jgi:hypothetical protein
MSWTAQVMAMGVVRRGDTVALLLSMLGNSHDGGINVSEVPQYHSVFDDVRILECQQQLSVWKFRTWITNISLCDTVSVCSGTPVMLQLFRC